MNSQKLKLVQNGSLHFRYSILLNKHPSGQRENMGRGKRGGNRIPLGGREEGGAGNQRTEFLCLCLGESTKAEMTHQFVVRILLNRFPKKSTELSFLPSFLDGHCEICSLALLSVSLKVA